MRRCVEERPPQRIYLNLVYRFSVNVRAFDLAEWIASFAEDRVGSPPPYFSRNVSRAGDLATSFEDLSGRVEREEEIEFAGRIWRSFGARSVKVSHDRIEARGLIGTKSINWSDVTAVRVEVTPRSADIGAWKTWRYRERIITITDHRSEIKLDLTPGYFQASTIRDPDLLESYVRQRASVEDVDGEAPRDRRRAWFAVAVLAAIAVLIGVATVSQFV